MKKFLITILIIVIAYFALVGIFTLAKVCPEYVNYMPSPDSSGHPAWQNMMCPFSKKAY